MRYLAVLVLFFVPLLSSAMSLGTVSPEVKELQKALNTAGYTVTNYGEETTYFGPATEAALARYQEDHAAAILGGGGVMNNLGTLDPLTRTHLLPGEVLGAALSPFYTNLSLGMTHPDVKRLQEFLNTNGYTVAQTGPGSPGQESTYYGLATMAAVKRYQEANASTILVPNNLTQGTGQFLTTTRATVNARIASSPTTITATPTQTAPVASTQTTRTLAVKLYGKGTVTTNTGLTCSTASCAFVVPKDSRITLTARAEAGAYFSRWSGSCSGTKSTCAVTMTRGKSVTATFKTGSASSGGGGGGGGGGSTTPTPTPTTYALTTSVSGNGTISGTGIACGTDCTETYTSGTSVTLTATPASGATFAGWTGACSGTATTCTVSMTQAQSAQASFATIPTTPTATNGSCGSSNGTTVSSAPTANLCTTGTQSSVTTNTSTYTWSCGGTNGGTTAQCSATRTVTPTTYTLTVSAPTGGTVTGSGVSCGSDCTETYNSGTSVVLTATPSSGYTFTSWGGACSGTATTCTVSMSQARSVSATFTASTPTATNGSCGTAANQSYTTAPSTNLCTTGTQSSVTTNTSTYTWSCAGANGGTTAQCSATRTTAPTGGGTTYYFSDCQTGAATSCVPGNNANAGTSSSAPKRDLTGIDIDTLPAGTNLLFARGGSWNMTLRFENLNVTSAQPLTFADYGSGALPIFNTTSNTTGIIFGSYGDTTIDGGYTFRNLKLDGRGVGQWGAWVQGGTRDVIFDGVEIANFDIGIHAQQGSASNQRLTVRNSFIHHNNDHGILGDSDGFLIEGTRFEDNNPDGGGFEHGAYLGGHSTGITVRNSTFRRNSVNAATGRCDGGNLTIHGTHDSVLIEGNTIEEANADDGCFGVSLTAAYGSAEYFNNAVIRNNTIVNLGACALCISSAPGVLVENNRIYNTLSRWHVGVLIPAIAPGPGDAADTGAIIRNNLVCHTNPVGGSSAVNAPSAASIANNTYVTGAGATTGACAR